MAKPDQVISQRIFPGVDRVEDARIQNQGALWSSLNLYGRQPGTLAKRPGSKLVINGSNNTTVIKVPSGNWSIPPANLDDGEINLALNTAVVRVDSISDTYIGFDNALRGVRKLVPNALPSALPASELPKDGSSNLTEPVIRVAGLHRVYLDHGKAFWVGAYNTYATDVLWYIGSDGQLYILPNLNNDNTKSIISSVGADFFFIPFRRNRDATTAEKGYWAIGTNQLNQPFVIKQVSTNPGNEVGATSLSVRSSKDVGEPYVAPTAAHKQMYAVQALAVWQGAIVYGGYRMQDGNGNKELKPHYVTFSDPAEPHKLACNSATGVVYDIRIGDAENEPVTAMAVTSVETDSAGIKAQLVVFTEKRVTVFDGLPPVTDEPLGTNFSSIVTAAVGCNAPRSVVQTDKGVVFLGSDGVVYLIVNGYPRPIGTAVQSIFQYMSSKQQRQCAAIWDPEGFYKLSYPDILVSTYQDYYDPMHGGPPYKRPEADVADAQFWVDLRQVGGDGRDFGARWFGPMRGMKHSCMARADGNEDRGEIYAGSSRDGSIFQVALPELVTDPIPENVTSTQNVESAVSTGLYDLGDAHIDKLVTAFSYGIGTDRATVVDASVITNWDAVGQAQQTIFTRTVSPSGNIIGTDFTIGTSPLITGEQFELITERPANRMRGKTFRFFVHENPAAGAKIFFSDLSFRAIVTQRRI